MGYYGNAGKQLVYAGKVGTGYTREWLLDLRERLGKIETDESPFDSGPAPPGPGVRFVRPKLVAEIGFAEWTQNGLLRQPRFEGLRADKDPRDCRRERPRDTETDVTEAEAATMPRTKKAAPARALGEYGAKRNFRKTPEPAPAPAHGGLSSWCRSTTRRGSTTTSSSRPAGS